MKKNKNFLTKYYLFCLFSSLDFTRGIHLIYILSLGFDNLYTGIVQMILFASTFIFEIPFGYIADKYKKKYVLFTGSMFFVMSAIIYLITEDQYLLPLLYVFQGIGFALYSGADFSLLYNTIGNDKGSIMTKYLATSRKISLYSLGFAIIFGGYLATINWKYVFIIFLITNLIAGFLILTIKEEKIKGRESKSNFNIDFKKLLLNKNIFLLVLGIAFLEGFNTPFFIFFQNFLKAENFSTLSISYVFTIAIILSSLILNFEKYIRNVHFFNKYNFTIVILMISIFLFLIIDNIYIKIFLFFIINSIPSLFFVFSDDFINLGITDNIRSTFMSIVSFINSIIISITYLTIGFLFDKFDQTTAISMLTFLLIPSIFLISLYKKRANVLLQKR